MDIYESCPKLESRRFLLRLIDEEDLDDLIEIYSDKNALPFFNSDNCHGDNFYYPTKEKMQKAIRFWITSYKERWFVRWTIVDKSIGKAIGTIEMFHRESDDAFNHCGVIRVDVGSRYENAADIYDILSLIIPPSFDLFRCAEVITKAPIYAVERTEALKKIGFHESEHRMIGTYDRYVYKDYWTIGEKDVLK